jgi:outer membrane protein TolC
LRAVDAQWWRLLGDPAVDDLVQRALTTSPSLDEALARVDQARAHVAIDRAAQAPRVDLNATAARSQIGDTDVSGTGLSIRPIRQSAAAIGPSFSWEIDLWGRLRRQRAASQNRVEARLADMDAARLSIAAQIADTVVVLRACRLSVDVRESDIASRSRELAIARQRLAFGSIAPADVAGSEANLANVWTDRLVVQGLCLRSRDALVALVGGDAAAVEATMAVQPIRPTLDRALKRLGQTGAEFGNDPTIPLPVPPRSRAAMPAIVLSRHPAVVAAERELAARWMEIGVARAERLPRLDLTAVLTGQWLSALGSSSSFSTWSVGPGLSMPVLDGGAGKGKVRLSHARYRESLASLNGVMRDAAREIEDSLADQQSAGARVVSSGQAVSAAGFTFRADEARWRAGAISAFDLETSRRALNTARQNAIVALRDRARAWIALVRSTGGATETLADPAAANTIGRSRD